MSSQSAKASMMMAGRALEAASRRPVLFEDPGWDERFETLIRLTNRTSLIMELTGTNIKESRLKHSVDARLAEMGNEINRPRGAAQTYSSKSFLGTKFERYDATYLLALHFGASATDEMSKADTNLARALDHAIEVYSKYQRDCYPGGQSARLSFETYMLLIRGIKEHAIDVRACGECGARHPVAMHHLGVETCPVCAVQDLKLRICRTEISERIEQRRSQRRAALGIETRGVQRA